MKEQSPQAVRLAYEIADTLNDQGSIPLFIHYAEKHDETFLRNILNRVMSIPQEKIKKTRGALFTFLVSQYENNNSRG